jgi:hypothetical protein
MAGSDYRNREEPVSLTSIADDIKAALAEGQGWLVKTVEEHVPALLAEAERVQGNPIVQAVEAALLPPEVEAEIVNVIKAFAAVVSKVPAPAVAEVLAVAAEPPLTEPSAEAEHVAS